MEMLILTSQLTSLRLVVSFVDSFENQGESSSRNGIRQCMICEGNESNQKLWIYAMQCARKTSERVNFTLLVVHQSWK